VDDTPDTAPANDTPTTAAVPSTPAPAVAFTTLGCKVNHAESERIIAELLAAGARITGPDEADAIVVDTCTVTGEADAKARKAVRRALGCHREPLVVVTGCLAALDADGLAALGTRVTVVADKAEVPRVVGEALGLRCGPGHGLGQPHTPDLPHAPGRSHAPGSPCDPDPAHGPDLAVRAGAEFRTRAAVKVQDGCDALCSYCIVPHARGAPRSTALASVLAEVEALCAAGVAEVVLTGINLGRYTSGGVGLVGLVRRTAETGVARLRLSSIEPPDLTDELADTLGSLPAVCNHLHIPLQSGSDPVLRAMGRTYTANEYERIVARLRQAMPGLAITTDIIAGFPGESDADAARTLDACERIGFTKLHVFRYSRRDGTPAASMEAQVPPEVRARRAKRLRELGERLRREWLRGMQGATVEVLLEKECRDADGQPCFEGVSREYARVRVAKSPGADVGGTWGGSAFAGTANTAVSFDQGGFAPGGLVRVQINGMAAPDILSGSATGSVLIP